MRTGKRERRAGPRLELETAAEVRQGDEWISGVTTDLSDGGVRVRADAPVEIGAVLQVGFTLPTGEFRARAVVRHASEGELSLEFFELSHQAQMTLTAMMGQRLVSWG
jgi:hypothetical protein